MQGTYECFAEIARRRYGGSLAGTITLTAGLGGMGGAQPLAVTMNGGVALCVEVEPRAHRATRWRRATSTRWRTRSTTRSRAAARRRRERRALSVGLQANAADVLPAAAGDGLRGRHRHRPDERARPARGLHPEPDDARGGRRAAQLGPRGVRAPLARGDRRALRRDGRLPGRRRRGLRLRQQPARGGAARRLRARVRLSGLRPRLHPAAVLRGQGPVPLGRAVGRRGRHRRDRPRGARGVARTTSGWRAGCSRPASRSPSRGCRRGSAGWATASATGSGCASTRWCAAAS